MSKKTNDIAKWIIVALAVGALIFNTGVLYNEVKHNSRNIAKIEKHIESMEKSLYEIKSR